MTSHRSTGAVVVWTGEDDRYRPVRERATSLARERGASLILYDVDAASPLASPVPTEWASEGPDRGVPDRLDVQDLEAAGRAAVAAQVREARAAGTDAWGWLPQQATTEDLVEYARREGASVVVLPADLESPSLGNRLTGKTAEPAEEAGSLQVVLVDEKGQATSV
jgi:hypothetical protein